MRHFFESKKEAPPFHIQELTSKHSVAKVTTDILPGEVGQVRIAGVYWRARANVNTCLRVGQKVCVLSRKLNTLLVSPT